MVSNNCKSLVSPVFSDLQCVLVCCMRIGTWYATLGGLLYKGVGLVRLVLLALYPGSIFVIISINIRVFHEHVDKEGYVCGLWTKKRYALLFLEQVLKTTSILRKG